MKLLCYVTLGIVIIVSSLAMTVLKPLEVTNPSLIKSVTVVTNDESLLPQLKAWVKSFGVKGLVIRLVSGSSKYLSSDYLLVTNEPPSTGVTKVPLSLSALVITYNIPELPSNYHLRLSPEVIALILKHEVRYWDDPRIKELNPEVANYLPHKEIIINYLRTPSSLNEVLTTYLHELVPSEWGFISKSLSLKYGNGYVKECDVAEGVLKTPYSLGYVSLSEAIKYGLHVASVMNRYGRYVLPTNESMKSSVNGLRLSSFSSLRSELVSIIESEGPNSYPMTYVQYLVISKSVNDLPNSSLVKEFIKWLVSRGSKYLISGYVPLPSESK